LRFYSPCPPLPGSSFFTLTRPAEIPSKLKVVRGILSFFSGSPFSSFSLAKRFPYICLLAFLYFFSHDDVFFLWELTAFRSVPEVKLLADFFVFYAFLNPGGESFFFFFFFLFVQLLPGGNKVLPLCTTPCPLPPSSWLLLRWLSLPAPFLPIPLRRFANSPVNRIYLLFSFPSFFATSCGSRS